MLNSKKAKGSILLPDTEFPLWNFLGIMVYTDPEGQQGSVNLGEMGKCLYIYPDKIIVRILE